MDIINDQYWLKYAKSSVETSLTSRNKAAAKLEKMTLWFWGIYTAAFSIGVTVNAIEAPALVLAMLSSPIILLIITYWFSVIAQLPVNAEFDPRIPYEIKNAYNAGLRVKNRRFRIARWFTLLSAGMLSVSLFAFSFVDKKMNYSINAEYISSDSILLVSGVFPKGELIQTNIDSTSTDNDRIVFFKNSTRIQENDGLNINVPVNTQPKEMTITVMWVENGNELGVFKTIKKNLE